jgi:nitrogen-specific signal transduction histidine kinase
VAKVFELFPHGIMLLDGERHVLRLNEAGKVILGDQMLAKPVEELTCCELFGCRTAGGPLEGVCLTEMALGASASLPEMRIDLPAGGAAGAVWVSAARVPSDSAQVLLELRPGDRRDRRRRSSPRWAPPTELSVFTLGRTLVTSPAGTLNGRWLSQRPGQVLKYLVCERRRTVSVERSPRHSGPAGTNAV